LYVAQDPITTANGRVITPAPLVVPDHYPTVRDNPIITLKLPEIMGFDGKDGSKDRTDLYMAALNSHDGSAAFRGIVTPIRIVCANTQTAAIREAKASFAIRHTGSARIAIQQAREALKLAWHYLDVFQAEAANLYAQPMDTDEVRAFANRLVDVDGSTSLAAKNTRREQASGIVKLWVSSATVAPMAGTRRGAYNAVTEFVDHHAKVRGRGNPEAVRALRAVTTGSNAQTLKSNAFRMLQTL
jgi:phage/plasmid-like protein (TIGR03299 family)